MITLTSNISKKKKVTGVLPSSRRTLVQEALINDIKSVNVFRTCYTY